MIVTVLIPHCHQYKWSKQCERYQINNGMNLNDLEKKDHSIPLQDNQNHGWNEWNIKKYKQKFKESMTPIFGNLRRLRRLTVSSTYRNG